jgi:hypothetical protein
MRTIHFHPEQYLGIEIVPIFSQGTRFCRKGMEHIAEMYPTIHAWEHKGIRGSGAMSALALSGYTLAVAVKEILPRFDQVLDGYQSHCIPHDEHSAMPRFIAFGSSSTFALFAEMNEYAGVEQAWIIADILDERTLYTAEYALTECTRDYHLGLADWHWKEWIDLRDRSALKRYLRKRYHTASRSGSSPLPASSRSTDSSLLLPSGTSRPTKRAWWKWW